jgi:hypothetical protein
MGNKTKRLSKEQLAVIEHRKKTLEENDDFKDLIKRLQKFEDEIAAEKYGKKFYELSKKERIKVTDDAGERETKEMLLWGRPEVDRKRLEKLSADELIEVFKVK